MMDSIHWIRKIRSYFVLIQVNFHMNPQQEVMNIIRVPHRDAQHLFFFLQNDYTFCHIFHMGSFEVCGGSLGLGRRVGQ